MRKLYVIAVFALAAVAMVSLWSGTRNLSASVDRNDVTGYTTGEARLGAAISDNKGH
jgi:hypothetical protein